MSTTKWDYGKCSLCSGSGKVKILDRKGLEVRGSRICPVCEGFGLWEFVIDDNYLALLHLTEKTAGIDDRIRKICDQRIDGLNPSNIMVMLTDLGGGMETGSEVEEKAFHDLHAAGAKLWGWGWLNANRFAIELAKMNGVHVIKYRYALTKLVWGWLGKEGRRKT